METFIINQEEVIFATKYYCCCNNVLFYNSTTKQGIKFDFLKQTLFRLRKIALCNSLHKPSLVFASFGKNPM